MWQRKRYVFFILFCLFGKLSIFYGISWELSLYKGVFSMFVLILLCSCLFFVCVFSIALFASFSQCIKASSFQRIWPFSFFHHLSSWLEQSRSVHSINKQVGTKHCMQGIIKVVTNSHSRKSYFSYRNQKRLSIFVNFVKAKVSILAKSRRRPWFLLIQHFLSINQFVEYFF